MDEEECMLVTGMVELAGTAPVLRLEGEGVTRVAELELAPTSWALLAKYPDDVP